MTESVCALVHGIHWWVFNSDLAYRIRMLTILVTAQGLGLVNTERQLAEHTCGGRCYPVLDATMGGTIPFR